MLRRIIPFVALVLTLPAMAVAETVLLYDLPFSTPPHTVGLPPVIGAGPMPRETVTDIPVGDPIVVASHGALTTQPLEIRASNGEGDQIELSLSGIAPFPTYRMDVEVLVTALHPDQHLIFHFDTPEVRNVSFDAGGVVRVFVPGGGTVVIGGYTAGVITPLAVEVDLPANRWTIWLDGVEAHAGDFGGATALEGIRVSTQVAPPVYGFLGAIDNMTVTGEGRGECGRIGFNDLIVGEEYAAGTSFTSSGVTIDVSEHFYSVGSCAPPTSSGAARVVNSGFACGAGKEINVENVTLAFDFGAVVTDLLIPYGEYGGTVSLGVNGDCRVVENFADLNGTGLGGALITVFDFGVPGQGCGVIRVGGAVVELTIGGQELFVDNLSYCVRCPDPLRSAFDDQTLNDSFGVGDTFASGSAVHRFRPFHPPGPDCSEAFSGGIATIGNGSEACGSGLEVGLNNISDQIDFGHPVDRLLLSYGEFGGNINLRINGECRNVENFADLHGEIIGGVHVWAVDYGQPGQSCGTLYAVGWIEEFGIGGQELWIDNIRACPSPLVDVGPGEPVDPIGTAPPQALSANQPNPSGAGTLIRFQLGASVAARLTVHDVSGRQVRALVNGTMAAGSHEVWWDGRDDHGRRAAAGVYHYRLESPLGSVARRMVLLP